ncbi:ANTAR domain-containing protein [Streptomyces sp. NPDC055056]
MSQVLTAGQNINRWSHNGRPTDGQGADAVIEQATGIVMALGRLPADKAAAVLTEVSQRNHIEPARIAGLLIAWASCGELNLGIRIALEEAIQSEHRAARRALSAAD